MTKEPIMIDDVDVAECENALQGKHTIVCACSEDGTSCDSNKNCLYKEYKRKEQECEEWKKDYTTAKGMYDLCQSDFMELAKIKDKYKQALQEIKEVIKKEGYINKKTQIVKGSVLYQAMEDLKLPDKKILKIINEVLDV